MPKVDLLNIEGKKVGDIELAEKVSDQLEIQIPLLPRSEIARESIDNYGKIIISLYVAVSIIKSLRKKRAA